MVKFTIDMLLFISVDAVYVLCLLLWLIVRDWSIETSKDLVPDENYETMNNINLVEFTTFSCKFSS